jgi:hypothetical protein
MSLGRNDTLLFVGRKKIGRVYIERVDQQLIRNAKTDK